MKRTGYVRTIITEDDLKNQLTTLQSSGCDDISQEAFGPQAEISVLDEVEKLLSAGDTPIVRKLHHLGKTTCQLTDFMKMLKEKQVDFVSIPGGIDTHLPTDEAYFQLMESLSATEYAPIKERTLVGLHRARENGKVGGRPKTDGRIVRKICALYYENRETIQPISNKCGVSVDTCYKYINLPETDVERLYS